MISPFVARSRSRRAVAVAVLTLLATACGGQGDESTAEPRIGKGESLLDGDDKSFVIVGHSTSYAWPQMLQEMLDAHSGGERRYHVLNAAVGGSPVSRWIADPESEDYDDTFGAMLRDFFGEGARLRDDAPPPTVALCQQSLQFTGSRRGPILDADDADAIRTGADALEKLAERLREHTIERVYLATHIYSEPGEPEIGNERLALAALLDRGHEFVFAGPDLWTPTRDAHTSAFNQDRVHPNPLGMRIMAEHWYRVLAGEEARQEVIDRLYATEFDVEAIMTDYLNGRRP
jgi:hypothetical protein